MTEQWEVMWWDGSGASPDTPVRTPEGWEPFGFTEHGFWLLQTRPDALHHRRTAEPAQRVSRAALVSEDDMTETERNASFIRRALNELLILCGDDGADDADRVTIGLAHDGLQGLLNRIAELETRP